MKTIVLCANTKRWTVLKSTRPTKLATWLIQIQPLTPNVFSKTCWLMRTVRASLTSFECNSLRLNRKNNNWRTWYWLKAWIQMMVIMEQAYGNANPKWQRALKPLLWILVDSLWPAWTCQMQVICLKRILTTKVHNSHRPIEIFKMLLRQEGSKVTLEIIQPSLICILAKVSKSLSNH